jgi:GIY-YIG catalytic domain/NUMOD1 domain
MISGIYTISNVNNNKIYVGYANDLMRRKHRHFHRLRKKVHENTHLQKAYNKYGKDALVFEILEECPVELLPSQEHYWATLLNVHDPTYGYNIKPTHPEGKTFITDSTRRKISQSKKIRVSQFTLEGKLIKTWSSTKEASIKLKINSSSISLCINGKISTAGSYLWAYEGKLPKIIGSSLRSPVIQKDLLGKVIKEWNSISEASRALKIGVSSIILCCKERKASIGAFSWSYKKDLPYKFETETVML